MLVTRTAADLPDDTFVQQHFGDALPPGMIPAVTRELVVAPAAKFGRIISCSKFHGPGAVVLVGDAAHAVTSALGQGCNLALEGVRVLGHLMRAAITEGDGALADVPAKFTAERAPDVRALQTLERFAVVARAGANARASLLERLHVGLITAALLLRTALQRVLPKAVLGESMFEKLSAASVPYASVLAAVRRSAAVLAVCVVVTVGAAVGQLA